jgi:ribosomal protein L11 methyltransferase
MTDYIQVTLTITPVFPLQDILPQEMGDLGYDSFEETAEGLLAWIPEKNFNENALNKLFASYAHSGSVTFSTRFIQGQNWNKVWEDSVEPVIIPGKLAICAPFHSTPAEPMVILIEPRMAFGTGHHPTTLLMASHLIDYDCKNQDVLDMGCGTGILAVIASLKGANSVLAIDNEDPAVDNTLHNVGLNNSSGITVKKGSAELLKNRHFHIILANINRNVLWEHIPVYASSLAVGGQLWLSGFFFSDVEMLSKRVAEFNMKVFETHAMGDWQLMKCVKE